MQVSITYLYDYIYGRDEDLLTYLPVDSSGSVEGGKP